jgi:hypothetical protein
MTGASCKSVRKGETMQSEEIGQSSDEPLEPGPLGFRYDWSQEGSLETLEQPHDASPRLRRGALRRLGLVLSKSLIGGGVVTVAVLGVVPKSGVSVAVAVASASYSAYYLLTRRSYRR